MKTSKTGGTNGRSWGQPHYPELHITVISGLYVTYVSVMCNYRLWGLTPRSPIRALCVARFSRMFSTLSHLYEYNMQLYTMGTDPAIADLCSLC